MLLVNDTVKKASRMLVHATMLAGLLFLASVGSASANYDPLQNNSPNPGLQGPIQSTTLRNPLIPGAMYAEPLTAPATPQPPPVGDGPTPKPEIEGDQGNPPAPPQGSVDTTNGSIDGTRNAPGPKAPAIYVPNAGQYQTIHGQQQGVYDYGQQEQGTQTINNGGPMANAVDTVNNGGPRANAADTQDVIFTHNNETSRYQPIWVLPTVPNFCRYLVILGVVAATVWMIIAAMSMVNGNQYAGSRIIGTAGGLLLLLSGYTIWKIVQMNTMHANSIGWTSQYRNGQGQPLAEVHGLPAPNGTFPNGTNQNTNPYNDYGP